MRKTNNYFEGSLKTAVIALSILIVYIPAINAEFAWDDEVIVNNNIVLQPDGLYRVWLTTESLNYWPVTWTVIRIEHDLWGLNPTGYHIANILFHLVSTFLFWRILVLLRIQGAWLSALIFAIHPVNVESVAWITQHKNTISMIFFLASILLYLEFDFSANRNRYFLSLISFLFAMLSKGAVIGLPFVIMLIIWWKHGVIRRNDLLRCAPYFAIAIFMGIVELWFQTEKVIGDAVLYTGNFLSRLALAGRTIWFYLSKTIWPYNLSFVYPRWNIDPASFESYAPGLILIVLLAACWNFRSRGGRSIFFALACFIIMLGPVLGFLNFYYMIFSFVADHYLYYSIPAIVALIVSIVYRAIESSKQKKQFACALAIIIVSSMGAIASQQCAIFQNRTALWSDTIKKNPQTTLAHYNLGLHLDKLGLFDSAMHHYQQTLKIDPNYEKATYNIAYFLHTHDRKNEAIDWYRRTLQIDNDYVSAHNNLGQLLAEQGKLDEAIQQFEQALQIRPINANSHYNLAKVFQARNQNEKAILHYKKTIEQAPLSKISSSTVSAAYNELGASTLEAGQFQEAINYFRLALQRYPSSAESHYLLATALTLNNNPREAEQHFLQTLAIAPDSYEAHNGLGELYLKTNREESAIEQFRKAIQLNPDFEKAHQNLKNTLRSQSQTGAIINMPSCTDHLDESIEKSISSKRPIDVLSRKKYLSFTDQFYFA